MSKILVGLSGGVDSAIAAYLLKREGRDVTCAFMRNWDAAANDDFDGNPTLNDPVCPQEADYADALKTAELLGLDLLRIDFIKEYWDDVFSVFLSEYRKGRTPNPDILCNRHIKFDSFLKFARDNGFDTLATGHYAALGIENGKPVLKKAADLSKDQSYFLGEVHREAFKHVLFPLSDINKTQVREIARDLGLSIAGKKDSTGICFIGERDFRRFLGNYMPMKEGRIVNVSTRETIGTHKGVLYYTIGQRKGLDIGGTGPYYCVGKSVAKNELYVVDEKNQDLLYSTSCLVKDVNWLADRCLPLKCAAKFRYRQADQEVEIRLDPDGGVMALYPQGIRSVTPGQEAVFYDGDVVVAAGRIEQVFKDGEDLMEKVVNMAEGGIE